MSAVLRHLPPVTVGHVLRMTACQCLVRAIPSVPVPKTSPEADYVTLFTRTVTRSDVGSIGTVQWQCVVTRLAACTTTRDPDVENNEIRTPLTSISLKVPSRSFQNSDRGRHY